MKREEAIESIKRFFSGLRIALSNETKDAFNTLIPELNESEGEKIKKWLIDYIDAHAWRVDYPVSKQEVISYLKNQKDNYLGKYSEEENLAYRLNWVMQDYYKAGEDNEEREHRLKCYKLFWDALEDENFFEPIKMQVYEVGKRTTICGQDYKCKKDYKVGNCLYIKDAIYHCSSDGHLTDQRGVSWYWTSEWFNEYIYTNEELADKEKNDFVNGQFLQCKLSFNEFKEGEHYWLEYIGNDMYVGKSDNILNQKFHITPRQLYTLFSQKLEDKQNEQKPERINITEMVAKYKATDEYVDGDYVGKPLNCMIRAYEQGIRNTLLKVKEQESTEYIKRNSKEWNALLAEQYNKGFWKGKAEQKSVEWSEEDEIRLKEALEVLNESIKHLPFGYGYTKDVRLVTDWLKSIPERFNLQPKQEWSEEDEKMLNEICANLYALPETREKWQKFLKSLHPSWKPGKEQLAALKVAMDRNDSIGYYLRRLYEQLKKLM